MAEIKKTASVIWVDGTGQEKRMGFDGIDETDLAQLIAKLKAFTHAGAKKITVSYTFSIEDNALQLTGTGPYATVDQVIVLPMEDKLTGKSVTREFPAPVEDNIETVYKQGKRMLVEKAQDIIDAIGDHIPGGENGSVGGGNWYLTGEPWLKSVK